MIRGDIFLYVYKEPSKRRPCLILTATSRIPDLNAVTIVPLLDKIKIEELGVRVSEEDGMLGTYLLNISAIGTVPKGRIREYVAHLSDQKMREVMDAIKFAFGFDN